MGFLNRTDYLIHVIWTFAVWFDVMLTSAHWHRIASARHRHGLGDLKEYVADKDHQFRIHAKDRNARRYADADDVE